MVAVRFVLGIIPIKFQRVTDHHAGKGSLRLTKALSLKARANKRIGEWYLIAGLRRFDDKRGGGLRKK